MPEKIALVTGASGGLGTHVTKALLGAGFAVVGLASKIQQSDFDHPNFTALAQTVAETDDATFQRMFDMNFNSAFHILRAVLPQMRKAGAGRIIAIGSRAVEDPGPRVGAYSASKAALVSLMQTVARENNDAGVTANVILPGTIDTAANRRDMPGADTSQWVSPASIASLIVWLAGDTGKDVTGAVIRVYGRGL